ncbi:hypothetical protein V9T40_011480 [Parthenolecanium corni]|uniref:Peptidase S26 domain-containing protein n=1 Tax=Parthenolecanium corni TaxID=536013 RepID=A0AAN9XYM3_9HEMI
MVILKYLVKPLVLAFPIGVTFIDFVGYVARVEGKSMQPLLNPDRNKDFVFLSTWSSRHTKIQRGDVVSFISPKNPDHKIIKRVTSGSKVIILPFHWIRINSGPSRWGW